MTSPPSPCTRTALARSEPLGATPEAHAAGGRMVTVETKQTAYIVCKFFCKLFDNFLETIDFDKNLQHFFFPKIQIFPTFYEQILKKNLFFVIFNIFCVFVIF